MASKKRSFVCDSCAKESTGVKHNVYDENWNIQKGVFICDDCFAESLEGESTEYLDEKELSSFYHLLQKPNEKRP